MLFWEGGNPWEAEQKNRRGWIEKCPFPMRDRVSYGDGALIIIIFLIKRPLRRVIMSQHEQEVEKWKTVYKEVRGALDFRVANLNSQQQRIANVLFANGLIFGFL
jgi:hypothetical protein